MKTHHLFIAVSLILCSGCGSGGSKKSSDKSVVQPELGVSTSIVEKEDLELEISIAERPVGDPIQVTYSIYTESGQFSASDITASVSYDPVSGITSVALGLTELSHGGPPSTITYIDTLMVDEFKMVNPPRDSLISGDAVLKAFAEVLGEPGREGVPKLENLKQADPSSEND